MENLENSCNNLFSDPQLNELVEINKSSGDLLDLLSPRENQHSDILAWCFNSREGHDQGDTVLKDFLVAIFNASKNYEPGDRLEGKGRTRDFVRYWTPGRIASSSFGSAIFLREYSISSDGKGNNRIDLLIIDPDQKFMIVVENKAGAKLEKTQLSNYLNGIDQQLLRKSLFKDYLTAFVVLDRNYDPESESENDNDNAAPDRRWILLNYEWLGAAAKRAGHAIKRGNQSAGLLRSYCLRQSNKIEYYDDRARELIHLLAEKHSVALKELNDIRKNGSNPATWQKYRENPPREFLLRMYMQNPVLWDQLIDLNPMDILDAKIRGELKYLKDENVGIWRVCSSYRTSGADSLISPDEYWPIYIHIRHINDKAGGDPLFRVGIKFRPQYLPEDREKLIMLKMGRHFAALSKSKRKVKGMWIDVVDGLSIEEVKSKVIEMEQAIKSALK